MKLEAQLAKSLEAFLAKGAALLGQADQRIADLEAQLARVQLVVDKWERLADECQQRAVGAYERGDGDLIEGFSAQEQSARRHAAELRAVLHGRGS